MHGFLEAEERYYNMNKRLEHYRRMSAPAHIGNGVLSEPERVLEPVSGAVPKMKTVPPHIKKAAQTNTVEAVKKIPDKTVEKAAESKSDSPPESVFGIKLTRDNCLIIALIIMLAKEKADVKLIIALVYLLL
jgi:hypothetical protein